MISKEFFEAFMAGEYDYFLIFGIFFLVFITIFIFRVIPQMAEKGKKRAMETAMNIVNDEWQIIDYLVSENLKGKTESLTLELQSVNDLKRRHIISFRPGHPSIPVIKNYKKYQLICFEFIEKGLECSLEMEVNGYLKVII